MPRSDMRHPAFETYRDRDRRKAREEIARFLEDQAARSRALAGRRILPAIVAPAARSPHVPA